MAHPAGVLLDEIARTVAISAAQSAAIVSHVSARLERWIAAKDPANVVVPSMADIAVHRDGHLWWSRGRVVPQGRSVAGVGELLDSLLQQGPAGRAPAGLLYVVARATDQRHPAPFASLSELRAAVARHAPERPSHAVDALLAQYLMSTSRCARLDGDSSISDVRRLRRAGGITLSRISADTGIPVSLLRELEWGVFANWDPSNAGGSLESYAERAGLDPAKVAAIVRRETAGEQVTLVRVSVLPPPVPVRSSRQSIVPFALAATLVAAVVVAAPGDRSVVQRASKHALRTAAHPPAFVAPPRSAVRPAALVAPAYEEQPPARQPLSRPAAFTASNRRPADRTRLSARRDVSPPRPAKAAPAVKRPGAARSSRSEHALVRLARTITGDGRHKVEPFPKVQR